MKQILMILIQIVFCLAIKRSYNNYKLIDLYPSNNEQIALLNQLQKLNDFDVWSIPSELNKPLRVSLSPESYSKYSKIFISSNLRYEIIEYNLQNMIDDQERSMQLSPKRNSTVGRYVGYNEIINYIDEIVENNPDIASDYITATTLEGRQLKVLVLKTSTSKRSAWIDCGIHAREWVAVSSCVWLIDSILREYRNNDRTVRDILNHYEIHILPLVNPDGYEFSRNSERLWRKNRRKIDVSCFGVDLNRNFDIKWMTVGASNEPCSEIYAGEKPDSELETQGIINAINSKLDNWDVFMSVHSYGNVWMTPRSYTTELLPDYNELYRVAKIGTDAIKLVNGTEYLIGPPSIIPVLSIASGSSYDWTRDVALIKYSFGLEVRPGHDHPDIIYGFLLPESRAPVTGQEVYAGIKALLNEVKNL